MNLMQIRGLAPTFKASKLAPRFDPVDLGGAWCAKRHACPHLSSSVLCKHACVKTGVPHDSLLESQSTRDLTLITPARCCLVYFILFLILWKLSWVNLSKKLLLLPAIKNACMHVCRDHIFCEIHTTKNCMGQNWFACVQGRAAALRLPGGIDISGLEMSTTRAGQLPHPINFQGMIGINIKLALPGVVKAKSHVDWPSRGFVKWLWTCMDKWITTHHCILLSDRRLNASVLV